MVSIPSTDQWLLHLRRPTPDGIREYIRIGFYQFPKAVCVFHASLLVFINIHMPKMRKTHHWKWGDIRYIDPATSVECSGGLDGKPTHKPMNMIMGINDLLLVCPICQTIYASEERMNSRSVQSRIQEAERIKELNKTRSVLKINPNQRINQNKT